jgi:penicillin-binding protein 1A
VTRPYRGRRTCAGPIVRPRATGKTATAKSPAGVVSRWRCRSMSQPLWNSGNEYRLRQPPKVQGGHRRHGPAYRPRAGHGRRLLLWRSRNSTVRDAGHAPAGLLFQAFRLRGRPRQRLYAGLGHHGRADRPSSSGGQVWTPQNYGGKVPPVRRRCVSASNAPAT